MNQYGSLNSFKLLVESRFCRIESVKIILYWSHICNITAAKGIAKIEIIDVKTVIKNM